MGHKSNGDKSDDKDGAEEEHDVNVLVSGRRSMVGRLKERWVERCRRGIDRYE